MGLIKTKVGNAEVLIETTDVKSQSDFPGMTDTSVRDVVSGIELNVFKNAKEVINGIAEEFSKIADNVDNPPNEIKIGFSMSLTAEGSFMIVKGESSVTLNVELMWKRDE